MKNKDIDFTRYEVQFENIFVVEELHLNCLSYLRTSFQHEALLFLNEVRAFRDAPTKEKAQSIIDTHVVDGCDLEINIDSNTKKKLFTDFEKTKSNDTNTVDTILPTIFDEAFR